MRATQAGAIKIGVVGLGHVGLPIALAFAEEGHHVVGVEADPRRGIEAPNLVRL